MSNFLDAAGLARFFAGLGQKFAALSHTHGTADIEDGAITTAKLANMAVTTSKLGNKCVANGNLGDMSVQEGKIYPQAVTTTKIRDGAVTEDKLDAALKSKINAGGGGATVLYETSSPTEITTDNFPDESIDPAAECVTLTTSLVDADPEFIVVFASRPTGAAEDRAKLSTCIRRPSDGWQQTSYASGGQGQLLDYAQGFLMQAHPAHFMYHLAAYHRNDASYVRLIEARGVQWGGGGDTTWQNVSPGTSYPMRGLHIYKVVGIS